ncbi:MAG TPA: hypothetical protein VI956_02815 [Nitrospirota bacterium]|nr:hypothetical protein [Nitrospirota bacterium]
MQNIQDLIGKEVEVMANGMKYAGILIEVSDTEVHIRTPLQWVALPAESVSTVKLRGVVEREPEREAQGEIQE